MFFDDLPIWGFIGKVEKLMHAGEKPELRYYLFTHIHFDIHYNGDRVIEARPNLTAPIKCGCCWSVRDQGHHQLSCEPVSQTTCS